MEGNDYLNNIKSLVEKELDQYSNMELNEDDLDIMYKLIDIIKDIKNIEYWECKKEHMEYSMHSTEKFNGYNRRELPSGDNQKEKIEALENAMESFAEFTEKMMREADTPEARQVIRKYLRRINQMR